MDVTTSDGVRLNVSDPGGGQAPVVLIGGYGQAAAAWQLQVDALSAQHRVVVVDRRNHGASGWPAFGHRVARHAKDLREVLEALDLTDALLVGASMGSNVILSYLDLYAGDRLRGVVLVDQTPKMVNEADWQLGFVGLHRQNLDAWVQAFPSGLNPFHTVPPPEVLAIAHADFSVDGTRALLRDHAEADWRDVVQRAPVPLTAVAGRHSPLWPWESSAWMAENAPDGRLEVCECSGHVPPLEEPGRFNEILLKAAS